MPEQNGEGGPEPSEADLVLRGILLLVAAFITANIILIARAPQGR
jgi:hypothetical protein